VNYSIVKSNFSKIDGLFFQADLKKEELDRLIMRSVKKELFQEKIERFNKILCTVFCNNCLLTKEQLENMQKNNSTPYMSKKMDEILEFEYVPSFTYNVVNY